MNNYKYLLLLLAPLAFNSTSKDSPIKMIYNNRTHIIDVLHNLNYGESLDTTNTKTFRYFSNMTITTFVDSPFSSWDNNEETILSNFLKGYIPLVNKYKKFNFYIEDSITVSILISFLDYPDYRVLPKPRNRSEKRKQMIKGKPNWRRDALNILTYRVYFNTLRKQSTEIIDCLSRCREPELDKLKLILLCKPSGNLLENLQAKWLPKIHYLDSLQNARIRHNIKDKVNISDIIAKLHLDSLLTALDGKLEDYDDTIGIVLRTINTEHQKIPLWVKALLGDTIAENRIISRLKYDRPHTNLILDASFVWSESCKQVFFYLFERDYPLCPPTSTISSDGAIIDYGRRRKVCRSLQDSLLIYLARHHPDEPIFQNKLAYNRYHADFCKPDEQVQYFIEFAKWVKKHYGFEIRWNNFKPYFIKDISKDQSAIRDICKDKK